MGTIIQQIPINASQQQVYNVITDFAKYPEWNPWVRNAVIQSQTNPAIGSVVRTTLNWGNGSIQDYDETITIANSSQFEWESTYINREVILGGRKRTITSNPEGGVIYKVEFFMRGWFSALPFWLYKDRVRIMMDQETLSLKQRCEQIANAQTSPA